MLLFSYISFLCLFQKVLCRYIYGGMRSPKPAMENMKKVVIPIHPKLKFHLLGGTRRVCLKIPMVLSGAIVKVNHFQMDFL